MKLKISWPVWVVILAFESLALLDSSVIAAEDKLSTNEQAIKEKPIIIQTQVQNYEQPTLQEYQECHENLDKCLKVCESADEKKACEDQCPTCPILIQQDVAVQGINDTDYRLAPVSPVNTTNVIRLTNEIRNIIDNNLGDISTRNENNVNIHQNISKVSDSGGKYGLGYNERGSCCHVIRTAGDCRAKRRYSRATSRCGQKRHRVCGDRCKARVMHAKRVTLCEQEDRNKCHQSIEYVPHHPTSRTSSKCQYTPQWPFVLCASGSQHARSVICSRCLKLPYGYILQNGIPAQCQSCFGFNSYPRYTPNFYNGPSFYTEMYQFGGAPNFDNSMNWNGGMDDEYLTGAPGHGWTMEKTKCRRADGTIIENCHNSNTNETGSGDDDDTVLINDNNYLPGSEDPLEHLPNAEDEIYDENYEYDDDLNGVDAMRRRRRHTFIRSAYSERNRQKANY